MFLKFYSDFVPPFLYSVGPEVWENQARHQRNGSYSNSNLNFITWGKNLIQQEYIPVGCVPPAHWPYSLVLCLPGRVVTSVGGGDHPTPPHPHHTRHLPPPHHTRHLPPPHHTRHLPPSDHVTYPIMYLMSTPPPPVDIVVISTKDKNYISWDSSVWQNCFSVCQHCVTISVNKQLNRLANCHKALWQFFSSLTVYNLLSVNWCQWFEFYNTLRTSREHSFYSYFV